MAGWNTLLIDSDLRKGNRYKRLGQRAKTGMSDYLEGLVAEEKILYRTNHQNLRYIPCGASGVSAVRLLCSERMRGLIKRMRWEYDFIILDTPAVTVAPDATVLFPYVDGIALVAALDRTNRKQLALAKRAADKFSDKYYGLIVNCVDKKQYARAIPQYDYFAEKRLNKLHKRLRGKAGGNGVDI